LVICKRKSRRYQTIYDLSPEEFKALTARHISENTRTIRDELKQIHRNAEDTAADLHPFVFEEFEKDFILNNPSFHQRKAIKETSALANHAFNEVMYDNRFPIFKLPKPEPDTILATFLFYISKLLSEHRIRTAANYQTTYNTISRFKGNVRFIDINVYI
jgi:integrase/recombinase XerD